MPSRVPVSLRAELSEYAYLMRALRVQSTQDLLQHLTQPPVADGGYALRPRRQRTKHVEKHMESDGVSGEHDEIDEEDSRDDDEYKGNEDFDEREDENGGHDDEDGADSESRMGSDLWTRWPLLEEDVYVPEWSLEDEVGLIAKELLSDLQTRPQDAETPSSSSSSSSEAADSSALPSAYTHSLETMSSDFLSQLFAAITSHWPLAEKSMQNRVKPISWDTVLEIVGAAGLVHASVLDNVRTRLEAIYGPSGCQAVERLKVIDRSKRKLDLLEQQLAEDPFDLLDQPILLTPEGTRKYKL